MNCRHLLYGLGLAALATLATAASGQSRFLTDWTGWDEKYRGEKVLACDTTWGPDILPGYESRFVVQPDAFDGPCRTTIVRLLAPPDSLGLRPHRAFLYVHGFNDYFFQSEMGREFVDSGFNFYAVDLRRYGRSRLPWQYPFNVRNQKEYFEDIEAALVQIRRDGNIDITLGGHSTGGLTVALMAADRGGRLGVQRVVTDSPFLEWNFSRGMRDVVIPTAAFLAPLAPEKKIPQGHCDGYSQSLLKGEHGEWVYNTQWKMPYSPPVTLGWIRSINSAQSELMDCREHIVVPMLVMCSSRRIEGCDWTPEFQTGDCVLNPAHIADRGRRLGRFRKAEVCVIDSGLHDLILSRPAVRRAAYDTMFRFIRENFSE